MNKCRLTVSLVIYRTPLAELCTLFANLRACHFARVCILDNGADEELRSFVSEVTDWIYHRPGQNLGYGKGHNLAFAKLAGFNAPFHLVLNPDIDVTTNALKVMLAYMQNNPGVGQLMPQILFPDGSIQHLCKLLPTPRDLLLRRFLPDSIAKCRHQARYDLREWSYDKIAGIPSLSGCFMLMRSEAFRGTGGFDPRYFMYMEDLDLCRRIGKDWETIFFPDESVIHHYAKGSYRSWRLFLYHMVSAIKYFNKWGWLFDSYRKSRNERALSELRLSI